MTSSPPDSRPSLRGLPGGPVFARDRRESGERPSVRAFEGAAAEQSDRVWELRAKRLEPVDREIAALAPSDLKTDAENWDDLCKRRAKAALQDAVFEAGSQRELSRLARFKGDKTIRDWLEIEQRQTALHVAFRVPDWIALVFVRHIVRHWGMRAIRELRAFCDALLGESDDGPVRRAI